MLRREVQLLSRSRRSRSDDRSQRDQHALAWRRIDLHLHTPGSIDYQDPDITYLDILRKAETRGADVIAFTDHNTIRGYANMWREIEDLELLEALERLSPVEERRLGDYRRILRHLRVLPGFELTATFGFHITAIFPEGTSIRQIEHTLLELNVPEDRLDLGTSEVGATVDVLTAYETLSRLGALVIPAHVNSTHGVAMQNLPFGGQTKIAFTQSPYIDALEATDLESSSRRSTAHFFNGSKPEYPRRMHIIQGSDAHRLNRDPNRESNLGVCDRMTEVLLTDVSFAALKELFRSDNFNRVRPYRPAHDPYDFIRVARAEGETIVQSFHEMAPARRGRLSPIVRDAAAFANGNGGTIYVGISAVSKDPVMGVEDAPEQASAIAEDLARYITPQINGTIDIQETEQKKIIVVQVPAGDDMPYAVLPSTIYVRQEGETSIAMRDEIVQLVVDGMKIERGELPELVSEPPAAVEAPHEPTRTRSSRRRGRGRGGQTRLQHEELTAEDAVIDVESVDPTMEDGAPSLAVEPEPAHPVVEPTPPTRDIVICEEVPFPRTGVEVVDSHEIDNVTYHAMRDLRNLKVVHNVTRDSARRLWRYAITQLELHPAGADEVTWHGDRGYWKAYKPRGGDVRYNLVYRHNDHLHMFYGVTDEGLDEAWRAVVPQRYLQPSASEPEQPGDEANGLVSEQPAAVDNSAPDHDLVPASTIGEEPLVAVEPVDEPAAPELSAPRESIVEEEPAPDPVLLPDPAPAESVVATPKPARRRRQAPKPSAEPPAEDATPEPEASAEPTPEAAPDDAPKPVRRRRKPTKVAEDPPADEAIESASVVGHDAPAEPVVAPVADVEPLVEAPKPVRRRRKPTKAEVAAAADETESPAEE